jgi:hypothetical protein
MFVSVYLVEPEPNLILDIINCLFMLIPVPTLLLVLIKSFTQKYLIVNNLAVIPEGEYSPSGVTI